MNEINLRFSDSVICTSIDSSEIGNTLVEMGRVKPFAISKAKCVFDPRKTL